MRKTIQHSQDNWLGPTITSKVTGMRRVKLHCGVTVTWYKIDCNNKDDLGYVSVPMRLHLDKRTSWFTDPSRHDLFDHIDTYKHRLKTQNYAEFTDVTKAEERLLAKMMMLAEMGVE